LQICDVSHEIRNASELAQHAGVSPAVANRFVCSLRENRFCEDSVLKLLHIGELLQQWKFANNPLPQVRTKWISPVRNQTERLYQQLREHKRDDLRACLGLFAACKMLGFDHVYGVSPHLYLEDISKAALEQLGLTETEPGEAVDVFVRKPRFPETVFRGARKHDGVPTTDIIQCWLDTSSYPARGEEMADFLWSRVIFPHLCKTRR
jgi:hypothetical protein